MTGKPIRVPVAWRTLGTPVETIDLHRAPNPPRPVGTASISIVPELPKALRRYAASREPGTGDFTRGDT